MILKHEHLGNAYTSLGYLSRLCYHDYCCLYMGFFLGQGHVDDLLPDTGKLNIADSPLNWCSMLPHGSQGETKMYWSTGFTSMKTFWVTITERRSQTLGGTCVCRHDPSTVVCLLKIHYTVILFIFFHPDVYLPTVRQVMTVNYHIYVQSHIRSLNFWSINWGKVVCFEYSIMSTRNSHHTLEN